MLKGSLGAAAAICLGLGAVGAAAEDRVGAREDARVEIVDVQIAQMDERTVRICNLSGRFAEVAKATTTGRNAPDGRPIVRSEGWYPLQPGACTVIYGPGLQGRFYYWYAQADDRQWSGSYPVCVSNRAFTIVEAQCGDGYMRRNFNQIDMAQYSGSFTMNLRP